MGGGVLSGKWCLITGASHGVGAAIAARYAEENAKLVLVARSTSELEQVAKKCFAAGAAAVEVETVDLMDDSAVDTLCAEQLKRHGTIDVLVNDAGVASWTGQGPTNGNPDDWAKMIKLDLEVPMRLTRRLSPAMVEKGGGTGIINMGSKAVYGTCKHGLRGWSLSCHEALRKHGVKVVIIEPGFIATPMTAIQDLESLDRTKMIKPGDVAEAALLPFKVSPACVPAEMMLSVGPPVTKKREE